ncbi:SMI1 / KNR4 family [Rhizoctonia solani]|uniref:SMI1 / KNR4 family n=1 Tax=Rhizoctonia solani TaxID=456999 RepID=A0A8H7HF85_9AGAM|nr:SMI1 / KNR4 family [Rhizoctonia solani]
MSFLSSISSFFGAQSSSSTGNRSTRTRTLTSTHDAFSLPTHSPNTSQRERMDSPGPQFSYPPASAYSPSTSGFDYMPQSTRDNFRRSTLSSPGLSPSQTSLQNTWTRIRKFMAREYPELGDSLNYGLAPAIIDQVEAELGMTLPPAVRESYLLCDGQEAESGTACAEGLFFGLTLLPLEEALDEWRFWREVDEDPTTGANPQLLQVMASIPTGWIRKAYSCRGWLPLVTDKAGNYLGVDLAPAEQGTYGQVIVFGRDFDTKVVMFRGEGEDGWATWLQNFIEELEAGEGFEVGATDSASEGSDDVGYESYFYDGSGRSKGVGGTRDGAAGMKLTGEYKGWNVLEAFADKSYRRWRERNMAPDLDVLQNPVITSHNVSLVGPGVGTGSGVEVPIPIMGGPSVPNTPTKSRLAPMPPIARNPDPPSMGKLDQPIPPTIQVTRASMAQPLLLPTQSDIVPDTSERDDLESGTNAREVVPLREMSREDSLDSVTSAKTAIGMTIPNGSSSSSQMATPTAKTPAGGVFSAEPKPTANLMDAQPEIAPVPALVPVPPPSEDEVAELTEGDAPETTIRLVGAKTESGKADFSNHILANTLLIHRLP